MIWKKVFGRQMVSIHLPSSLFDAQEGYEVFFANDCEEAPGFLGC